LQNASEIRQSSKNGETNFVSFVVLRSIQEKY